MSKRKYVVVIIILSVLLFLIAPLAFINYFNKYDPTRWFTEQCGNGYTLSGWQVGTPPLGGVSRAEIYIYDKNNRAKLGFLVGLDTDGAFLSQENYDVSTSEDGFVLTLYDYNQKTYAIYRFYYADLEKIETDSVPLYI